MFDPAWQEAGGDRRERLVAKVAPTGFQIFEEVVDRLRRDPDDRQPLHGEVSTLAARTELVGRREPCRFRTDLSWKGYLLLAT
jgi:hypothetical protein